MRFIQLTTKNHLTIANEQIRLADTGIGMTPEQAGRLFKGDFYTTKTTLNPNGTGLGLQICKEFVEQNKGEIWVESEQGIRTAFYFTIPLSASPHQLSAVDPIL